LDVTMVKVASELIQQQPVIINCIFTRVQFLKIHKEINCLFEVYGGLLSSCEIDIAQQVGLKQIISYIVHCFWKNRTIVIFALCPTDIRYIALFSKIKNNLKSSIAVFQC
jgi:hypothetical protein